MEHSEHIRNEQRSNALKGERKSEITGECVDFCATKREKAMQTRARKGTADKKLIVKQSNVASENANEPKIRCMLGT